MNVKQPDGVRAHRLQALGPFLYLIVLFAGMMGILSLSRACLVWAYHERVVQVAGHLLVFPVGARMDSVTASYFLVPAAMIVFLLPRGLLRRGRPIFGAYFALVLGLLVLMEAISYDYLQEYDNRPNRVFVEYLGGSVEIAGTIWEAYRWHLFAVVLLVGAVLFGAVKLGMGTLRAAESWGPLPRLASFALVLPVLFLGIRGTLDHRPVNPSTAAFSGDNLVNQLALNSTYSAAYALYSMRSERMPEDLYGRMPESEILARVARYAPPEAAAHATDEVPFLHLQRPAVLLERPRNLVIVLEESMGADFVGCLGGLPLTPNLDALSEEGLLLTNLYCTGTRTVRGIEATVTGFLPTPGRAVVKLGLAQYGFFTLAALLKEHGYATDFIYGGESHFDNMAAFLVGNGFDRALNQSDFENPVFHGTWGVSDEDLMRKANEVFVEHGERPFFALVLSTSNHSPFEYPEGRIELYDEEPATRNNALKYADYAIGELFRLARQEDYYRDTVWIVVADHNTRTYGKDLIPVSKFHIPGLILGPGVAPGRFEKVASQIDLGPSALHLLGLETRHPMVGRDLFSLDEDDPGRAVLQFYDTHGFLVGDRLAVHPGEAEPRIFRYVDGALQPAAFDSELERDGRAHALLPGFLYERRLYRF